MNTPPPFTVMTKPMGPRCNLDCRYCYYLEKDDLYPDEKKFRMSEAVLERYVRDLIDAGVRAGQRAVFFVWQGGEPTMLGLAFFEHVVDLQRKYQPDGVQIENAFQTNGTLLDDNWAAFFARENFLLGISIDGPRQVHDRYRRDRAGRPTFDAVRQGLEALRRAGVEYNILCAVHRANVGKGKDVYRFLRSLGTPHLQFIPIIERYNAVGTLAAVPQIDAGPGNVVTDWSVSPRAYGKFLCDIFDTWYRQDLGRVFVQFFEAQIGLWNGLPPAICIFAETCGNGLALEHNGDLYVCDHFVYPQFKLGNVMETPIGDLATSETAAAFGRAKRDRLTAQCRRCQYRFACHGGCPKHRILRSKDGEPGHNYFCESYLAFFHHAGGRLADLAANLAWR